MSLLQFLLLLTESLRLCLSFNLRSSYKDYSLVAAKEDYEAPIKVEEMTFAEKLHHILSEPEYSDFIAWESHGRAFRILIPRQLEEKKILHRYFGHSLFSTFLSQLRSSGLKPLVNTRNKGCYYHEVRLYNVISFVHFIFLWDTRFSQLSHFSAYAPRSSPPM